jgi:hypothetical protein
MKLNLCARYWVAGFSGVFEIVGYEKTCSAPSFAPVVNRSNVIVSMTGTGIELIVPVADLTEIEHLEVCL